MSMDARVIPYGPLQLFFCQVCRRNPTVAARCKECAEKAKSE